ncbi:MAG: polysaccharide biosynthesis/export family protein [Candidatus Omnitrophica bacterium]|nr:polysaccharide biosynthesis/export family protein [Candidatus Omnitrophota bacterium]MBU4149006.1 polysaccharide biosynthesis/export family protein [Candidatus Omnitrophota bacterium]
MITQIKIRLHRLAAITIVLIFFSALAYCDEYKVDAGDVLLIAVYEQPDLTTKTRVTSKGTITFPLLEEIQVKGFSVGEIERKITMLLKKDYLVNPQVNVFIEDYRSDKVFVMGFVNKPGEYELSKDRATTVLEAITMAGGFKEGAAPNGTKVLRIENGQELTITVKVTDITRKGEKDKDVPVKPGDIVVVPENFF